MAKLLGMASADLLLHPVRLRIIKAFLGDRALTTAQLAAELDDVPAGSLYRHVALLTRAGLLHVVAEHRIRGAVERTYALGLAAARVQPGEAATMTPDEHSRAFMAYVAGLLADFDRYLAAGTPDLGRDGAGYTVAGLYLTDAACSIPSSCPSQAAEVRRELANINRTRAESTRRSVSYMSVAWHGARSAH